MACRANQPFPFAAKACGKLENLHRLYRQDCGRACRSAAAPRITHQDRCLELSHERPVQVVFALFTCLVLSAPGWAQDSDTKTDESPGLNSGLLSALPLRRSGRPSCRVASRTLPSTRRTAAPGTWPRPQAASGRPPTAGTTWEPDFRQLRFLFDRLRRDRPAEPARDLGGHGREQQPAQRGVR